MTTISKWSEQVGAFAADALADRALLRKADAGFAATVIAEELAAWLFTRSYPVPAGLAQWDFRYEEASASVHRVTATHKNGASISREGTDIEALRFRLFADAFEMQSTIAAKPA